jgi:adenylate cyclase, class 2
MNNQEQEVKFYVSDLAAVQARLEAAGALLSQPRTHELNLRFDTPEMDMAHNAQTLRLRQDTAARLTFKGPATTQEGVRVRQEIEFVVSDFQSARLFLQGLGYQVTMIYEKYRAQYEIDGVHVMLDEMPYGDFVEIEGPNPASILAVNKRLGLDWASSVSDSYTMLFDKLRNRLNLPFRDLIFENFKDQPVTLEQLGVRAADLS